MNKRISRIELLAKLAENPKESLELINGVWKLYEADEQPDPLLKLKAVNIANSQNKYTPRHVNQMTNGELQEWISQNS